VKAAKTGDCATAALAAVVRERYRRCEPRTNAAGPRDATQMTRQLCVLAHYELLGVARTRRSGFHRRHRVRIVQRGNSEQMGADDAHLPQAFAMARCKRDDMQPRMTRSSALTYTTSRKRLVLSKIEIADPQIAKVH